MSNRDFVEFEARCLRETDKALLLEIEGEEFWIPKSQIGEGTTVEDEGDVGIVLIPEWLAEEKGLQ